MQPGGQTPTFESSAGAMTSLHWIDSTDEIWPRQVADLRILMLDSYDLVYTSELGMRDDNEESAREATDIIMSHIPRLSMWWVSEEMTLLLEHAATSMPSFNLLEDDLDENGFGIVFFQKPIDGGWFDVETPVHAMSWMGVVFREDERVLCPGILIRTWGLGRVESAGRLSRPHWMCSGGCNWEYGRSLDDPSDNGSIYGTRELSRRDARRLAALWRLSAQPGLAEVSSEPQQRAQMKRSVKSHSDTSPVRVIYLRRQSTQHEPGEGGREYHHRWMVSGHWRNQPWGPKRALRRPVWIAPHIKGPDDKPLDIRPTVKALVR